jgi:hypothetical protein
MAASERMASGHGCGHCCNSCSKLSVPAPVQLLGRWHPTSCHPVPRQPTLHISTNHDARFKTEMAFCLRQIISSQADVLSSVAFQAV